MATAVAALMCIAVTRVASGGGSVAPQANRADCEEDPGGRPVHVITSVLEAELQVIKTQLGDGLSSPRWVLEAELSMNGNELRNHR